jgi:hypothetical protein
MTELVHAQCKLLEKPTTKSNTGELKGDSVFREPPSVAARVTHAPAPEHPFNPQTPKSLRSPPAPPYTAKNIRFVALTRAQIRKKALAHEAHAPTIVKPHGREKWLKHRRLTTNKARRRVSIRRRRRIVDLATKIRP